MRRGITCTLSLEAHADVSFCALNLKGLEPKPGDDLNWDKTECTNHHHIPTTASPKQRCENKDQSSRGREREDAVQTPLLSTVKGQQSPVPLAAKAGPGGDPYEKAHSNGLGTDSSGDEIVDIQALCKEDAWDIDVISCPRISACVSNATRSGDTVEVVDELLQAHPQHIPFHDPCVYMAKARGTRSVADFKTVAFPDLWGHRPPPSPEPMLERKRGIQR